MNADDFGKPGYRWQYEPSAAKRRAESRSREPLYSIPELAIRLGIDEARLRGLIKRSGSPKPAIVGRGTGGRPGAFNKYKLSDFRTWLNSGASQ